MARALARPDLRALFDLLHAEGWAVVGPTVQDDAIVYAPIRSMDDLPVGWTEDQAPGRYRLRRRDDDALFGFAVGPHSWKQALFPPVERLRASTAPKLAFLGVRACDLAAIGILDRVFTASGLVEPRYAARRAQVLILAVNCSEPGGLCFCASTGTGPRVRAGADLVLTERPDGFLVEAGSEAGEALLGALPTAPGEAAAIDRVEQQARARMGRTLDTERLPQLLFGNLDHPRWDEVADRCLSCGNCTLVCPTCFCSTLDTGDDDHERVWDSCFVLEHSQIHGATFRPTTKDRYRQWLTHKFGSWVSQFGTSGCVGCGRCVAWCPVGIDVTEELAAIRVGAPPVAIPTARPPTTARADDLLPARGVVVARRHEAADVVTLHIDAPDIPPPRPGQFAMLGLPAIGEAPISVSGDGHVHTIRAVGAVTRALTALDVGATVEIRGPYGSGWPLEVTRGRPTVLVAGGLGIAPLRPVLKALPEARVVYGAREPSALLFPDDLAPRSPRADVTVDRAGIDWTGHVGVVTRLLGDVPRDAIVFVCGPEIMMRATLDHLVSIGVPLDQCWLSMERRMECAAGFCGRCQYAHWFVCKDGPVFRADVIAPIFGRDGF